MKQLLVGLVLLSTSVFASITDHFLQDDKGLYALAQGRVEARCSNLVLATITLNHFEGDYSLKDVVIYDLKGVNAGRKLYRGEPTRSAFYVDRHPVTGFTGQFIFFVTNSKNNVEAAVYGNKTNGVSLDLCNM